MAFVAIQKNGFIRGFLGRMMTDTPNYSRSEVDQLTSREMEVLRRLANGCSDQEIAQVLFLSVNTVKWHNRNIYAKLGVTSRVRH